MKTNVIKNFNDCTFIATREIPARISGVWRAFSESNLLDKWWAPKPWRCKTKVMEFKPDGTWIYDMVGPRGERSGSLQTFKEIIFEKKISGKDAFLDKYGKVREELPVSEFEILFTPMGENTLITFLSKFKDKESLSLILELGLEEGLDMAFDNLEELLLNMK